MRQFVCKTLYTIARNCIERFRDDLKYPIFYFLFSAAEPEPLIRNEKECAYQGGICSFVQECPEGSLTAVKGLCPQQQYMGVECCYGSNVYY